MVKFSVGGYDDGEGPSNPSQKRRRVDEEEEDAQAEEDNQEQPQQSFEMEYPHIGTQEQQHSNHGNEGTIGSSGSNAGPCINERGKNVAAIISDPDVLDCLICYEPMTIPVFQCENGHIACSSCCTKIRNKCPLCSMPIGYYRCRAMEKLLDSIKISCPNAKYGCKEMFSYSVKSLHEKQCKYLPCLCPDTDCDFFASSRELALHFSHRHVGAGFQFTYDKFVSVFLNSDRKTVVLRDEKDVRLFIVHNNIVSLGNAVTVSCLGPKSMAGLHYDILARSQGTTLILQSSTKIIQENSIGAPTTGFLLIPSGFFCSGQLKLDIRIKSQLRTFTED